MKTHECMLVLMRGYARRARRNSSLPGWRSGKPQSWREPLIDVKRPGLKITPEIAVGDGALGFLEGARRVFPGRGTPIAGA